MWSLNRLLPPEVKVMNMYRADQCCFHPRLASSLAFTYTVHFGRYCDPTRRWYRWHRPVIGNVGWLNDACAASAAAFLGGTQNFSALFPSAPSDCIISRVEVRSVISSDQPPPWRTSSAVGMENSGIFDPDAHAVEILISGSAVTSEVVRGIAGILALVADGALSVECVKRIVKAGRWVSQVPQIHAPAHGLVLDRQEIPRVSEPLPPPPPPASQPPALGDGGRRGALRRFGETLLRAGVAAAVVARAAPQGANAAGVLDALTGKPDRSLVKALSAVARARARVGEVVRTLALAESEAAVRPGDEAPRGSALGNARSAAKEIIKVYHLKENSDAAVMYLRVSEGNSKAQKASDVAFEALEFLAS